MLLKAEANGGVISGNKRNVDKRSIAVILFFVCVPLTIPYYDTCHTLKLSHPSDKLHNSLGLKNTEG
jgi:hypothetical protein